MKPGNRAAGVAVCPPMLSWCRACGRTVACSEADLRDFERAGWPRCCGEAVALFIGEPKPRLAELFKSPLPRPGLASAV
jgi:hypothetical protein